MNGSIEYIGDHLGKYVETNSPEETFAAGRKLGLSAKPGEIYTLSGSLGAGKTVFAQGVAAGLGIRSHVSSPTFTIVQIFEEGRMPLYHFDVYRIGDVEEMYEIGYEDYFFGDGVCLIEWAELISDLIPPEAKHIKIEKNLGKGCDYRRITIEKNREKKKGNGG